MREFTHKELMEFGRDLKIAKATVMNMWGFTADEISAVTGMTRNEIIKVLPNGRFHWGDKTDKSKE